MWFEVRGSTFEVRTSKFDGSAFQILPVRRRGSIAGFATFLGQSFQIWNKSWRHFACTSSRHGKRGQELRRASRLARGE